MKYAIIGVIAVGMLTLAAPAGANASSFVLKPAKVRNYYCRGNNACVKSMRVVGAERLMRIAPGCWSSPLTFGESCTVNTDCREQAGNRCWAWNGSGVAVRVRLGRRTRR